jgi:glyoxylase-like metal-dependent hydrolase (beta-lactamase superfamily II)
MIDGSTNRFLFFSNSLATEYTTLRDGQLVTFDDLTIKCIATPGHTPGSMSYLVNDKFLFVGDSLSLIDGQVELFNDFFNMDNETQTVSLRKLAKQESVTHIFSAHYGVAAITDDTFARFK